MTYETLDAALDALANLNSTGEELKNDLVRLASEVSIEANGVNADATTVLYSGKLENGVYATDVVSSMADDPTVRTVDKTLVGVLLNDDRFRYKVAIAFGITLDEVETNPLVKQWLYRDASGPWVNTSIRFVEATVGDVRLLTLAPDVDGVLYKYELPALLEKEGVQNSVSA